MKILLLCYFYFCIIFHLCIATRMEIFNLNLPPHHMAYYFTSHPNTSEACLKSSDCPYKDFVLQNKCWGYEKDCRPDNRYSSPVCGKSSKGWTKSKQEQIDMFYKQGDFGYIRERKDELFYLCKPQSNVSSSLECTTYMRFCRAKYIMFDFKSLESIPEPMRYREDVIREGQVGGYCKLNKRLLKEQGQHKSPLQSWYAEFQHFTELPAIPKSTKYCNVYIDQPIFIMKLDAAVNMYHHFCDFLNLYATLHLNGTFSTDIQVLIWDTIPYASNFADVWRAFTQYPLMNLVSFKGKKVCFKDAVFPLLPRMIFGMYYNMPLVPGCQGSGLFRAFSEHLKHRLHIKNNLHVDKVRVTLISRSTQYRKILNEDELISSLKSFSGLIVRKVNFNRQMSFKEQMEISSNTDILIGIHGAGLTHMLFMPDWGVVFEIFNCEDENCYADLARLKGLKYLTWEKSDKVFSADAGHHPTLGAHAKFTNYSFDVEEFLRLFKKALNHVRMKSTLLEEEKACKSSSCNKAFFHNEL